MLRLPLAALLALLMLATAASAQESARPLGARLTQRGRTLVSGRVMGFWSNDTPQYYAGNNSWSVRADPALTYFVRNHFGLGAALSFGWSKGGLFPTGEYRARDFALGGEFVWSAALAPRWRLLLRPFIGYVRQWGSTRGIEVQAEASTLIFDVDSDSHFLRVSASLPIIYALNENIGVGLAPEYLFDIVLTSDQDPRIRGDTSQTFNFTTRFERSRMRFGLSLGFYASF